VIVKSESEPNGYLSRLFSRKSLLKIFHGCLHSDVAWLQRDFGVAVVNVFDTQEAYKQLLRGPNLSLTHLWTEYCPETSKFNKANKAKFQTSDWSERPLGDDMLNYAAHDSFFLIYIA
jgi:ribonuclease D